MCWARELWADNGDSPFGNGLEITWPHAGFKGRTEIRRGKKSLGPYFEDNGRDARRD